MKSAFGVDHGVFSKMYEETRLATPADLRDGEWVTGRTKKPGKVKSLLFPKRAKKQTELASRPIYATRHDEQLSGEKSLLSQGRLGSGKDVKTFSRHVGGEYNPSGKSRF